MVKFKTLQWRLQSRNSLDETRVSGLAPVSNNILRPSTSISAQNPHSPIPAKSVSMVERIVTLSDFMVFGLFGTCATLKNEMEIKVVVKIDRNIVFDFYLANLYQYTIFFAFCLQALKCKILLA